MQSNTVAIIDAHRDTVEMLARVLADSGLAGIHGPTSDSDPSTADFLGYMARHDPEALIWNIAPPYERSWAFFKLLRRIGPLHDRAVVLTTTDKSKLDTLVAQEPSMHVEVLGKPYQPELMLQAVKRAIDAQRAQSTAGLTTSGIEGPRPLPRVSDITTTPAMW